MFLSTVLIKELLVVKNCQRNILLSKVMSVWPKIYLTWGCEDHCNTKLLRALREWHLINHCCYLVCFVGSFLFLISTVDCGRS